jgi:hypothetical protein
MNMNPDETRLALWLEDELHGQELADFENSLAGRPELFAAREETRRWRGMIRTALPATEEPPYPDFLNHRVMHGIRAIQARHEDPPARPSGSFSWRQWFMPVAACAGMLAAFWLGGRIPAGSSGIDVTGAPRAIPVEPILYTPENGVSAEWFASTEASATVIVIHGVDAIPDSTDFSKTVFLDPQRDAGSTAGMDQPEPAAP